ncbi:MAG: polyphenol oxidase family protein [Bacteroidota bacterium]
MIRPDLLNDDRLVGGVTTRAFAPPEEPLDATRARLGAEVGMAVASVGQVHEARVAVVTEAGHVPAHDGLVTAETGLLLTVVAADCGLVVLADPKAGVTGACHSGWRGTVAGIVGETVGAMRRLGAEPVRMRAYLGPCISAEAFEVGEEVAARFPEAAVVRRPEWPRPHVDLKAEVARQLAEAGVGQVEVDAGCTVAGNARFYSYRVEAGAAGRILGFVGQRA